MYQNRYTLAVISASDILKGGLADILSGNPGFRLQKFSDLQMFQEYIIKNDCEVAIIDSSVAAYSQQKINQIRKNNPAIQLILLVYQYVNAALSSQFDSVITIDQPANEITDVISTSVESVKKPRITERPETLSDRETEVLRLLVTGFSAKEIGDKLNISVNTVISHRKNISHKTGIKSLAGLTIYAVTRQVISMNTLKLP
ncbi:MAG TPA: LuxR C-terminal-related transcriptional regulator [Lentimicrobium sp.]|nr:LuxR C-terminal-related transcriptional regulator [Lentimicrobium sp.]